MFEYDLLIISSYALLGAGIKYIDQAYDQKTFSKKKANLAAILCGLLMAYLVTTDPPSTAIFLAMITALLLTKKIDNPAFYIGMAIVIALPLLYGNLMKISLLSFGFLTLSGILDEAGNDWTDKRINKRDFGIYANNDPPHYTLMEIIFEYRLVMKGAVLALAAATIIPWTYFFAFMAFDLSYLSIDLYSAGIKVYRISRAL
jgi:hypothetical protein